jgi:hypothetical protein
MFLSEKEQELLEAANDIIECLEGGMKSAKMVPQVLVDLVANYKRIKAELDMETAEDLENIFQNEANKLAKIGKLN